MNRTQEVERRRTFAIISHPDAGKTTLTEKLLLFSGAIHIAGSVKARKASRHATSDWMEIEKQRGISVASSVMQMEYKGCVLNLLDTPGHQDFSEDTYRVLTAVDAALMVIDAANGVEDQTRRLLQVCKARNIPIITFVNKFDREVKEPLELLDEIERELGMPAIPMTWPIGMGREFFGVMDLNSSSIQMFDPQANEATLKSSNARSSAFNSKGVHEKAKGEIELLQVACDKFVHSLFLQGEQTPVYFGSAINNFGVDHVLSALVALAPPPQAKPTTERWVDPSESAFTGVVFKIQANMDPAHRDRVAFVRTCSGKFHRGMNLYVSRNGKPIRTNNVISFMSQRRGIVDEAYPGDIVGIPNHGNLRLGDTLTESEKLQFTGLPFFAPELFRIVEIKNPLKIKQLRQGLKELGEEGAIQVFRPDTGSNLLIGAIGQLQFEIVEHRLKHEYGVDVQLLGTNLNVARWLSAEEEQDLKPFMDRHANRIYWDVVNAPTYVTTSRFELDVVMKNAPTIQFHSIREQHGLADNTVGSI